MLVPARPRGRCWPKCPWLPRGPALRQQARLVAEGGRRVGWGEGVTNPGQGAILSECGFRSCVISLPLTELAIPVPLLLHYLGGGEGRRRPEEGEEKTPGTAGTPRRRTNSPITDTTTSPRTLRRRGAAARVQVAPFRSFASARSENKVDAVAVVRPIAGRDWAAAAGLVRFGSGAPRPAALRRDASSGGAVFCETHPVCQRAPTKAVSESKIRPGGQKIESDLRSPEGTRPHAAPAEREEGRGGGNWGATRVTGSKARFEITLDAHVEQGTGCQKTLTTSGS